MSAEDSLGTKKDERQEKPAEKQPAEEQPAELTPEEKKAERIAWFYDNPMREFPLGSRILMGFIFSICGAFTKLVWPWTIENADRLWKAEGGQVIVMNHVSMLDPVVIVCAAWFHGRRVRTIYKSEFDKVPMATWLFARAGAIPVKRGTADLKAVRLAERALKRGEDLLIFPEGTRIRTDDQEVEIHGGFALIARLAKAPVVPVGIVGARDITPQGTHFKRLFWRVFLRVGEPLRFSDLKSKKSKEQTAEMETLAMERVYELRDALRAEHPKKH